MSGGNGTNVLATMDIQHARLPQVYEHAKNALAECQQVDECQDWANKAEALASYARQAADETLRRMADRIQARAVSRAGVLLQQFQNERARTDLDAATHTQRRADRQGT